MDALNGYSSSAGITATHTNRWLVGPTVELHLPFRLSFEADALYRREGFQVTSESLTISPGEWFSTTTTNFAVEHESLNSWQFPFLAKYELRGGAIRPFIDTGVTYQHLSGIRYIDTPNMAGFTVGGGLTMKFSFLRLSPEVRYTRWGNNQVSNETATARNQTDVLVGFTF